MEDSTTDPWGLTDVPVFRDVDPNRDYLTVTLKAGAGFDAPWLVFHFNSLEEAAADLANDLLDEVQTKATGAAKAFQSLYSPVKAAPAAAAKPSGNSSGYNRKPQASSAPGGVPTGTCPTHNCDLVYTEGFQKRDGSSVNARVGCPVPKCYAKTIWQNDDGTWKE